MYTAHDITVYVPCFKAGRTVDACMGALLGQSLVPRRFLAIDDGSPQPLALAGVEVIRHSVNSGLAAARNTALAACETPLIASVDADVVADRDWLARLLAALNEAASSHPMGGAGGRLTEHYQQRLADRWRAVHMAQHWGPERILNPRFLYGANTLLVADEVRHGGGYDMALRTNNEDRVLSEALVARGLGLVYEPRATCRHLRQDGCRSILQGYWQWHHAKGLQRGDFDSPEGLLRRIGEVNFGISRYRFDKDRADGRNDFLGLDAAIAWVFCALDLRFFARRHQQPFTLDLWNESGLGAGVKPQASAAMLKVLGAVEGLEKPVGPRPLWQADYLRAFDRLLDEAGWQQDCELAQPGWAAILDEEGPS
jgi:glycosyltransferase involved in cell wall biosynthesis